MIEIVKIIEVKPVGGHRLHVRFSNGDEGEADFSWLADAIGAMIEPLTDEAFFARSLFRMAS